MCALIAIVVVSLLTKAPEHRTTPNGISVTTFSVAVTRRMNREESDFLNVVTWRGLADNCAKYLVKGQQAAVCGELRTRSYDAKDGTKRYVTEIQADDVEFLAKPKGAENREAKDGMFAPDDGYMPDDDDLHFEGRGKE